MRVYVTIVSMRPVPHRDGLPMGWSCPHTLSVLLPTKGPELSALMSIFRHLGHAKPDFGL